MTPAVAWTAIALAALSSSALIGWVALTASGLLDKRSLTWWWLQ